MLRQKKFDLYFIYNNQSICSTLSLSKNLSPINKIEKQKELKINSLENCDIKSDVLASGVLGNPFLYNNAYFDLSISHSTNYCVVLVFHKILVSGIDIEEYSNRNVEMFIRQITKNEEVFLINNFDAYSVLIWTFKEALSKALRVGLGIDFNLLEIENISEKDGYFECYFKNFYQFIGIGVLTKNVAMSFVITKNIYWSNSHIIETIINFFGEG